MSVKGWVTRVRREREQTEATAAATIGATAVSVEWADLFADAGTVEIDGTRYAFTRADGSNVLALTPALVAAVDVGDPLHPVVGGQVPEDHTLEVDLGGDEPVDVVLTDAQRPVWLEGDYSGAPVPVVLSDDQETLLDAPGREPTVDGTFLSRAAIGERPEEVVSEAFAGTSLPAGWTSTTTGPFGTGSASPGIPGASVVATGPTGQDGSALLVDFGPAGTSDSGAGEVASPIPATAAGEVAVRFRSQLTTDPLFPDQAHLSMRRQDGVAWSSTDDRISLSLLGVPDVFLAQQEFRLTSVVNGTAADLGIVYIDTDATTEWHWAKLQISGGVISAKVWRDADAEPDWMLSVDQAGVLTPGLSSIIWKQNTFLSTSRGQKLWIDQFEATNYAEGFVVNPDGSGDWPALRALIMAEVRATLPRTVRGVASVSVPAGTNPQIGTTTITYDEAFPSRPGVQLTVKASNPHNWAASYTNETASGFDVKVSRVGGTGATATVAWQATY